MKKTLALILALSLVLGAMSGIAFAAEVVVTDEAGLLAAVANDGEITLGGDITLSETVVIPENVTVVLDLKGCAITMEESIKTTTYAFNNLGNLTIKDTGRGGSVSSRGIYNGYGNGADNVEDAVITILSGTYNALGTNGGAAIFNYGKANINGGSFTSVGSYSLSNQAGSSMTIAAGVTANNGIYASNATLVINGGEIKGNRSGCHVVYAWSSDVTINGGDFYNNNSGNATVMCAGTTKAVINGGTFGIKDGRVPGNGNTWTSCLTDTKDSASLVVNGGTFNGGFRVQAGSAMTINGGTYNDRYGSNYNIYGTVVVNSGTFEDATAASFATAYLSEESTTVVNPDGTLTAGGKVAKINDTYYPSIDSAIAAAAGSKITLLADAELNTKLSNATINIDLNGYTMDVNVGSNYIVGANSISNGTVDISKASSSQNVFGLAQYATPATTLTMDNVDFVGDGFNSGYAVFEIGNSGADVALTITNSTIDLKNDNAGQGGFVKGYGANCVLNISKTEVTLDNTDMFNVNVAANISDSKFTISNLSDTAFRNLGGTIVNTDISVTNSGNGIRNSSADYNLTVSNNSSIKISGSTNTEAGKIGDLVLSAGNKVTVDATSELLVETSAIADASDVTGNVVSKADSVYVQFAKTDLDANGVDNLEGADTYDIILLGGNAEKINELASADLSFVFDPTPVAGGAMSYEITPAEGVTLTKIADRYMFNYDGVAKYEETDVAIKIGAVKFEGYGTYNFSTAEVTTNAVYATEIRDNIVDGFEDAANLKINADAVDNDGMIGKIAGAVIDVPKRTLTINIAFPNAVVDKAAVYQDMKVEITGNIDGVNKTVKYDLGGNMTADGKYVVTEDRLVLNNAYTVTVSGAGYRTARYTVTMTGNKELNFWNNVMDEKKAVEPGKASSEVTKNFLAGDIVKDNQINIYDLSAVVSYFATTNETDKKSDYAKYDLNRDGVIDSKDVAYVLVSWKE